MVSSVVVPNYLLKGQHRLKKLDYIYDLISGNVQRVDYQTGQSDQWHHAYSYDANGNIQTQLRYDETATGIIDQLSYNYKDVAGAIGTSNPKKHNRLYNVQDSYNYDAFDIDPSQGTNNYTYDAEGRLIGDAQEKISAITWRVDGKVKKISRNTGFGKKNISFDYDAMGHRIAKHVYTDANVLERSTYYILDAQGKNQPWLVKTKQRQALVRKLQGTMSTYERVINSGGSSVSYTQTEKHIYGSSRLGVHTERIELLGTLNDTYSMANIHHHIGNKTYELTNHLGNVLSVISDKVIPHNNSGTIDYWLADLRQSTDYSPFGVMLHNRDLNLHPASGSIIPYRYSFQGQEHDDEIKGAGNSLNFEYRMHDPRIGRFFAIDPLAERYPYYSPYSFSGNRVIDSKELEGLEPTQSIINKGVGNIIITVGSGDNDIVNKAGMATANAEGSTFDHIHGNNIQDVEAQIQSYMATYKLESLKTIIWHQHGGTGYLGVKAQNYQYDDINKPVPGRASVDIEPGAEGSLQKYANAEFTGSNLVTFSAVKSFVNVMNKIGKNGNIVFASCATAAKCEGHYSDYAGQFSATLGNLIGFKANVYTNIYLTNAVAIDGVIQSLLNFPLSYGVPLNPEAEIGWYVQKSKSEGKGFEKIETNSIQVTSEGKVEYVNSERIEVPNKPHE